MTIHPHCGILSVLSLHAKTLVIVLIAVAFLSPLAAALHCDDHHEVECQTECACLCHSLMACTCLDQAIRLMTPPSERTRATDMIGLERLSIADIFRPPTAA